jgi:hypothetical protein
MEKVIKILREIKDCHEKKFIESSIIKYKGNFNLPMPDPEPDLEMIIELNEAIAILQKYTNEKK